MSVSLRESKWQFARVGRNIFCLLICPECRGNSSSCLQAIQLTTLSLGSHVGNLNCTLLRTSPLRMGKPAKTTNQEKPGNGWGILVPNHLHIFIPNLHELYFFQVLGQYIPLLCIGNSPCKPWVQILRNQQLLIKTLYKPGYLQLTADCVRDAVIYVLAEFVR